MSHNMTATAREIVRPIRVSSDSTSGAVRATAPMRAGEMIAFAAGLCLETGDYSRVERGTLHDMRRETRKVQTDRSCFGRFVELAPRAQAAAALWLPAMYEAQVSAVASWPVPVYEHADTDEERTNYETNLAQLAFREWKSSGNLDRLVETALAQRLASQVLPVSAARLVARPSYHTSR